MTQQGDISLMDQVSSDAEATAALHAIAGSARSEAQASTSTVSIKELPVVGLLTLRAAASRDVLSSALQAVTGVELPSRLHSLENEQGTCAVRWMSPDEWLVSCDLQEAYTLEKSLRAAVSEPIAVVNVSGGYSRFILSGANARDVLKKSTGYDVHPVHFPAGKVVNTTFAKAQVTLRALPGDAFEIMVRRSFADYLYLWIQRAGKEYGLMTEFATSQA